MSGDCPECGGALVWGGMGWTPHTDLGHRILRRALLKSAVKQLTRLHDLKEWELHLVAGRFVGIRWRNGVYPGWESETRSQIPYEAWDALDRDYLLRMMREGLSGLFEDWHGIVVNQATWFHKIYDPRA